jgi:hypothetical protein
MRVDNRVTQVPPLRTREADHQATSRIQPTTDATVLEESYRRTPTALGHQPVDLLRAAAAPWRLMVTPAGEATVAGAPRTGLAGEPVAEAIAEVEATQTATSLVSHAAATSPMKMSSTTSPPRQAKMSSSPPFLLDFAICFSQRSSSLWDHQVRC